MIISAFHRALLVSNSSVAPTHPHEQICANEFVYKLTISVRVYNVNERKTVSREYPKPNSQTQMPGFHSNDLKQR